jgi:hypothetical protein
MKEKLKEALRPIYDKMLKDTSINGWSETIDGEKRAYPCMAPVVGNNYPKEPRTGFMFYGRANNGWEEGVDDTFDTIYNAQLDGLHQYIRKNKSAFLRVAGRVFSECYGDDWLNHVVYSNLYKVSRPNKNPTDPECRDQLKYVKEIFEKEIETMSPKFVVLLTGENWAKDFVWHINGNEIPAPLETKKWSDDYRYSLSVYKIDEVYYIVSEHPQGKKEDLYAEAILSIFEKYK